METTGDIEQKVMDVVKRIRGGIVTINNRHFQMDGRGEVIPVQGAATGIVVSSSGYIVSNHHVVDGHQELEITTADGATHDGRVIGSDPATDVAIIKIDAHGLEEAVLGDSENLAPGRFVVAVGNALGLPGDPTVSVGVVSAIGRPMPWADFIFEGLIQTDAAINPGNSGGPLVNLNGEVIGMNTAIVAYAQGVGFAIPSATIKRVMYQILENGRVIRPWIGISGTTLHKGISGPEILRGTKGVAIARVSRYSPAQYAGLRPWDVITSVNGKEVDGMKSLLEQISSAKIGSSITLGILRNGRTRDVSLELQEMPEYYLESQRN